MDVTYLMYRPFSHVPFWILRRILALISSGDARFVGADAGEAGKAADGAEGFNTLTGEERDKLSNSRSSELSSIGITTLLLKAGTLLSTKRGWVAGEGTIVSPAQVCISTWKPTITCENLQSVVSYPLHESIIHPILATAATGPESVATAHHPAISESPSHCPPSTHTHPNPEDRPET